MNIILDSNNIATTAGEITVFNYDATTREYLNATIEYLAEGVGIPAHACLDQPLPDKIGFVVCRNAPLTAWEYIADHRGETIYSTETGAQLTVSELGDYPVNTTTIAPTTPYDKWHDKQWITDTAAQQAAYITEASQRKTKLLATANAEILLLQDAVDLNMATDEERDLVESWRKYRVLLNRVDVNAASNIVWPTVPN